MLTRICSCGKRVPVGTVCECHTARHAEYDNNRRDKARADFYHSKQWRDVSQLIRSRAMFIDELEMAESGRLIDGKIVHHIYPLSEKPELSLTPSNLILVSNRTHRRIHDAYARGDLDKKRMQLKLSRVACKRENH